MGVSLNQNELKALTLFLEGNSIRKIVEEILVENGTPIFYSKNILNGLFFRIKKQYKTIEHQFFKDYPDFSKELTSAFTEWLDRSSYKKPIKKNNFRIGFKQEKTEPIIVKSDIPFKKEPIKKIDTNKEIDTKPDLKPSVIIANNSNNKNKDEKNLPSKYLAEEIESVPFDKLSERYNINGKIYELCRYPLWDDYNNVSFEEKFYCGKIADSSKHYYCKKHKDLMFYYVKKHGKARK